MLAIKKLTKNQQNKNGLCFFLHPTALIESPVVAVESEVGVEEACDVNLSLLLMYHHPLCGGVLTLGILHRW